MSKKAHLITLYAAVMSTIAVTILGVQSVPQVVRTFALTPTPTIMVPTRTQTPTITLTSTPTIKYVPPTPTTVTQTIRVIPTLTVTSKPEWLNNDLLFRDVPHTKE